MGELHKPTVAILASGSGSTAKAFVEATQDGRADADVVMVIGNNPPNPDGKDVYGKVDKLNRKFDLDILKFTINGTTHPGNPVERGQTLDEAEAICKQVSDWGISHVALMGYMKQVNGVLLEEYGWWPHYSSIYQARMTNTHPAPLPLTADTFGVDASEKVLKLARAQSANTVQLVAAGIDEGPVLAVHPVDVLRGDTPKTLFDRVQIAEKTGLPYAIDRFLKDQQAWLTDQANE